jgi:hypothetical protein
MSTPKIQEDGTKIIVTGENYEVTIIPERLLILLRSGKEFYYGMCMLSAIDMPGKKDKSTTPPKIEIQKSDTESIGVNLEVDSNIWERKIHRYIFRNETIEYSTEVHGKGRVDRAHYFRGVHQEAEIASVPGFTRVFTPQANFIEKQEFHVNEYQAIGAGNYKEVCDTVWGFALHGGPLCFVCHDGEEPTFMSAGILAEPGEYGFKAFEMNYMSEDDKKNIPDNIVGTEAFSLAYDGHLTVDGRWETPKLLMRFSQNKKSALKQYLNDLTEYGGIVKRENPYDEWTYEPTFCTWHEQVALGMNEIQNNNLSFAQTEGGNHFFNKLTQDNCCRWLGILEKHNINPGTIILDAKWQKNVGDPVVDEEKFPDLRGFVDECHDKGIKVILWYNGWDRDGVPDEECCLLDAKPVAVDPTNPAFRLRVKNYMKRLLSDEAGCYNADGLKVDGMTATPLGTSLKNEGGLYGFEFARALLELIHKEAKSVKPDCAIGQFTAFPYFADLCDFARTGDLYTVKGDPNSTNKFRAMIQELVMPGVAIDTDGALRFNYALPDIEVLTAQEEIGVPCLYQAEHLIQRRNLCIESIQLMDEEKYKIIAESWRHYRQKISTR